MPLRNDEFLRDWDKYSLGNFCMRDSVSKLASFLNNNSDLEIGTKSKKTYVAELFSKSQWLMRLKGEALTSDTQAPKAVQMQAPKEVSKPVEPVIKASEPVSPTPSAPKKVESATPKAKLSDYVHKKEEKEQAAVAAEFKFEKDFSEYLKAFDLNWTIDQIPGINSFSSSVDVLFFGLDELSTSELPETTPISLIESEQDLLGKMIKAMNLKEGQFVRFPLLKGDKQLESLLAAVEFFKPKVVVPLGANSTNIVLEKRVKLSNVHGQFEKKAFRVNGDDLLMEVSPLFHPQLLEINQSMKRTAWIDMQKVMKFVGNI
jgi:DNA polymerase